MSTWMFNSKRTLVLLHACLLVIVIALAGCSQKEQLPGNAQPASDSGGKAGNASDKVKQATLIYHFKSSSLDPAKDYIVLKAGVVETLVRLDEKLEVQPWLATKWETKDNKTWKFTIRDGVSFQDGLKLDATAVKASLERSIAASKSLKGALKIASMTAAGQELTLVTSEPHPALLSELINPYSAIISVEAEKKLGTQAFNAAPVGTGPFKVKKFTPNVEILLERYDGYWAGAAKLNEVAFKFNEDGNVRALALQSKEADIATQIPAESVASVQKDSALTVETIAGLRVHFLLFNPSREAVKDVKVRKALDMLLNRESIAKDIMLGNATPANGPFNTRLPFGSQDPVQKLDIEGAKKLLEEAGYTAGANGKLAKDGKPLTLEIVTYKARPELPLIAQLLQSDAGKAGVTINIQTVENIDTFLRENKNWDMVTYSNLSAPRGDGGYFLNSALMPGGSLNAGNISIEKLTAVITRLNATSDVQQRNEITQEALAIIKEEVPHAYAVYPNVIVGLNKRITDWKPGAEEYYIVTHKMDVK
ncbi:nickel ABC transporter substrate-binding protein [Paenibacillus sp. tmac-D7]|uniref:nickel ABC transporter substrate-binding protein n=1 Tax=Paenibacillus sp. tmac-D7 TaxID=2591462 RepID=UPI00215B2FE4|nr:nickel ABC transporter substrate-binding protein [Paenibacillus sp. tmac-D7]